MRRQTVGALAVLSALAAGCGAPREGLTVFAAASTAEVVRELAQEYREGTGTEVRLNFASSGTLARQIEAGAPADVFVSASMEWADYLMDHGLTDPATQLPLMGNALVLIAPADSGTRGLPVEIRDMADRLKGRLALGDPDHVPAGYYAREALRSVGIYERLRQEQRLLPTQSARDALAVVEMGECNLGIVYATDALQSRRVVVVYRFPATSHPPIRYVAACTQAGTEGAARFVRFLRGPQATRIIEAHGFMRSPVGVD